MLGMDSPAPVRSILLEIYARSLTSFVTDVAELGKKVVAFYKKKGGFVVSPLVSAL